MCFFRNQDIQNSIISLCNNIKINNKADFFFVLRLRNWCAFAHLGHISIQPGHIPGAQKPHWAAILDRTAPNEVLSSSQYNLHPYHDANIFCF